jgi:hypothetical protein
MINQTRLGSNRITALNHWAWIVPILLVVSMLAIRQIDLYSPTLDEFFSLYNAGAIEGTPYSPFEIIQSLETYSPQHVPGYFFLLSVWGNMVSFDVAIVRILTIFASILSLAMVYRLARDFVTPMIGVLAVVILASNAFFNLYVVHTRMYPFLVLFASLVLWLYLRLLYRRHNHTITYLALFIASYALINTHIFAIIFLVTLGIYHLLFVAKTREWWLVSVTITAAMTLFSPYLMVLLSGVDNAVQIRSGRNIDVFRAIEVWLTVAFNGNITLLGVILAGFYLAWRDKTFVIPRFIWLFPIYLVVLGVISQVTGLITENGMRYVVAGFAPLMLFVGVGMLGLYLHSRWTIIILVLWIVAGLSFQRSVGDWYQYTENRVTAYSSSPYIPLSRIAREQTIPPTIIGFQNINESMYRSRFFNLSPYDAYFNQYDIVVERINQSDKIVGFVEQEAIAQPSIWFTYRHGVVKSDELVDIQTQFADVYTLCHTQAIGVDTVIEQYIWDILDCELPNVSLITETESMEYIFYTAVLDEVDSQLWFIDEWNSIGGVQDSYNISYQLLSPDWDNVAQIDLPLVHEDKLRRFALDIGAVPAGSYRLIAVLYDVNTGERFEWQDLEAEPPYILTLTEIEIP